MIVEMREYTLQAGKVPEYLRLYQTEGLAIQERILGNMVGYFQTEVGVQNQVVHLWAYRDFADREERRAQLQADEGWRTYVAKIRPFMVHQESRILRPAPFFEPELRP